MMQYQLLGTPKSLNRPRFSNGHVYNDQKSTMLIDYLSIKAQHGKQSMFFDPIHMDITFIFEPPKSYSPKKREAMFNKPYVGKKDVDNCIKMLMDTCTGALYTNDNIVTSISAEKIYGQHAKTIFSVTRL